jgi:hypothetical protein
LRILDVLGIGLGDNFQKVADIAGIDVGDNLFEELVDGCP